ncbi:histidine phosphatase family protein [Pseudooceanicola sp. LIPI14-2-Ac024]|uniref:histidine phosphatase family protein n=1 Tax=Pseudooceanicola sp. LIPI14-2-Ac024 TaxID=3344875 RepID=UPI0035CFECA3
MSGRLWYLSHPQVVIDPAVPVTDWGLTEVGRARLEAFAARADIGTVTSIWTSSEAKARETGAVFGTALGLDPVAVEEMGENDRSASGFLPPERFEAAADAFFAHPDDSFRGWETARAAQARIVGAAAKALAGAPAGDVLFCGHGAVGSLLWCHLAGQPISRDHDQPGGGGCLWTAPRAGGAPEHGWRRIEDC